MSEETTLELISKVALMKYHQTKDRWWKKLANAVEKKEREGKKWWLK